MQNKGILAMDSNPEIQKAYDFFNVINILENKAIQKNGTGFTGINEYGVVDLVYFNNKAANLSFDGLGLNEVIDSLSNILIAAVLNHAKNNAQEEVSPENWRKGFDAMASLFYSSYSVDTEEYNEDVVGKETMEKIIKIAFDVNGVPTDKLDHAIKLYLEKQGKLINEMGYGGTLKNPYTLLGFSNFVKDNIHTCSLRAYFTNFDTNSVKITETCKDDKLRFNFNFKITHCNADFMLDSWESNSDFKKKVENFINDHQQDPTFFSGIKTKGNFIVQ